jgi:succinate dehydrogenase / fumarate reductase cytochrome b subunit
MWITGAFVLVFLVIHVNTFFVTSRFVGTDKTMYELIRDVFVNPWVDAFYLVALVFLGYHLRHGFQSACQTFGLRTPRYEKLIDIVGIFFWLLIPLAFACIPLYFLWTHSSGGY